ncbi:MAG: VOC family protein [Selenomonadaceae bacterium]|nr:VOC family protein [Selenomonadaceae bacterium]
MDLVKGLHHTALRCCGEEEMNEAAGFYVKTLGLNMVRRWGEGKEAGCMIEAGNGIIEFFADAEKERETGVIDHIAFYTDKVEECVENCRKEGLTIVIPPENITVPSEKPYPLKIAFVKGKAGEIIEFIQEL